MIESGVRDEEKQVCIGGGGEHGRVENGAKERRQV